MNDTEEAALDAFMANHIATVEPKRDAAMAKLDSAAMDINRARARLREAADVLATIPNASESLELIEKMLAGLRDVSCGEYADTSGGMMSDLYDSTLALGYVPEAAE